jgi:glucose 1-dehydrogenase
VAKRFEDKVCLVTGAASGIGRSTAVALAAEGARVAVVDRDTRGAEVVAATLVSRGSNAIALTADVGVSGQVRSAIEHVTREWSHIDVVVNNAAMMTFTPLVDLDEADWDRVMGVNLRSIFLFCKYSVPHMREGSSIINVSSVHAHETTRNVVPYATSKGGVESFTRGFSEELADKKIRINCVAPGAVDTPMLWNNPNVKSGAEKVTGAIGKPEDIAEAILFLASPAARFITGTTLVVDGGRLDIL